MNQTTVIALAFALPAIAGSSYAFEPAPESSSLNKTFEGGSCSPYAALSFPTRPLWGDTHLHTSTSFDAGAFGNRLDARADDGVLHDPAAPRQPGPERPMHVVAQFGDQKIMGWEQVASGLAAVWAEENTREVIFDAMERKEVYATTGSRIGARFFGGWEFTEEDITSRTPAFPGYQGVPMGGDLPATPEGASAPTFMVFALKDPIGANLNRIPQ